MSFKKQAREIVFQNFLEKNLSDQEKNSYRDINFNFEQLLNAPKKIKELNKIIQCISMAQTMHNIKLPEMIKMIASYINLEYFYFFRIDNQKKTIELNFNFPNKNKLNQSMIKINQAFLNLALHPQNDDEIKSSIANFFNFPTKNLIFQKFILSNNQLSGLIFYTLRDYDNLHNLQPSLRYFWEIILTPQIS